MTDIIAKSPYRLLAELKEGMVYAIKVFPDRNLPETTLLIKAPAAMVQTWYKAPEEQLPLDFRWEIEDLPSHPILRLIVNVNNPRYPFAGEVFFNVSDPTAVKALTLLKDQDRMVVEFFSSQGSTGFRQVYPWRALIRRETRKVMRWAAQRLAGIPETARSYSEAKEQLDRHRLEERKQMH